MIVFADPGHAHDMQIVIVFFLVFVEDKGHALYLLQIPTVFYDNFPHFV